MSGGPMSEGTASSFDARETLGERVFTPLIDEWRAAIHALTGLERAITLPWQRTDSAATVAALFHDAAIQGVELDEEADELPFLAVDDAWKLVMGTGLRSVTSELDEATQRRLREHLADWVGREQVGSVLLGTIYAVARQSADTDPPGRLTP